MTRRVERVHSEPASFPRLAELLHGMAVISSSDLDSSSPPVQQQQQPQRKAEPVASRENAGEAKRNSSHFFPEATGAATFIELNGHLSLAVVLKVFGTLMERCSVVRVSEVQNEAENGRG